MSASSTGTSLGRYTPFRFEGPLLGGSSERTVYRRGAGPAVVVMTEVPGIIPEVITFADRLVLSGLTVFLPDLFGVAGKPRSRAYELQTIAKACVSHEFRLLAANASSPITEWLRALAKHAHQECGGPGVGAIGMCLTGNFALSLFVDPWVVAPVLSQPSLPFRIGAARTGALHVSPEELVTIKRRTVAGERVLGLRFTDDVMCPSERFRTLERELGDGFEAIEIDSAPGNAHGVPRTAHSVVTRHLVDEEGHPTREALDRVLAFFRERLL